MIVKVCGLKYKENIYDICQTGVDFIGFIFYKKSPRYVENQLETDVISEIPNNIKKIGVFVNSTVDEIKKLIAIYDLTGVQLHGNESPELCRLFKKECIVIKAFSMRDDFDFSILENYVSCCDYFLFDTFSADYGGSGLKFNWQILQKYRYDIPFFLSGGISIEDVDLIRNFSHPQFYGIDINSKFEVKPGFKDVEKVRKFISLIKK